MKKFFAALFLLILLCGLLVPNPALAGPPVEDGDPPVVTDPSAPLMLDSIDNFGYIDELLPDPLIIDYHPDKPWWVISGLTDVPFSVWYGNALSDPVYFRADQANPASESFLFPFYENVYDSIRVSVNGVIRLGTGQEASDFVNYPLPSGNIAPAAPTNIIAPLWADLDIHATPDTTITYRFFPNSSYPYVGYGSLVIEWENVARVDTDDLFSFGVALQEDGVIYVLLKDLPTVPGSLTIGIQDDEGEDGLMYYYPGSSNVIGDLKVVKFTKPSPDFHVKSSPAILGAFTQNGRAGKSVVLRNTTDVDDDPPGTASDFYNLSYTVNDLPPCSLSTCWRVQFLSSDWSKVLIDNDGDAESRPDTPYVAKGGMYTVNLRITAPSNAQPGDHAKIVILADSYKSVRTARSTLRIAVPVGFAQAYQDNTGAHTGLIWALNQSAPKVNDALNNNLAIKEYAAGFCTTWNEKLFGQPNTSVSFAYLSSLGVLQLKVNDIDPSNDHNDRSPALGVDPLTGEAGLAWVRETASQTEVWFAVLDPSLPSPAIKLAPFRLSASMAAISLNNIYPAVTALGGGEFLVAWPQYEPSGDDLYVARVTSSGVVSGPTLGYGSSTGNITGVSLEKVSWAGKEAVISFIDASGGFTTLHYGSINGTLLSNLDSNQGVPLTTTAGGSASTSLTPVSGSRVMLAWIDKVVSAVSKSGIPYTDQGVKYVLFNSSFAKPTLYSVMSPDLRRADYVSAGQDKDGRGILIWSDYRNGSQLYYMLVNPNDLIKPVTPALIYTTVTSGSINPGSSGQALAVFFGRFELFLPLIRK